MGRPVAQHRQDGWTLEVARVATDGTPNAPSALYAACWRATRALGYRRLGTYIQKGEPGTSLAAAGWRYVGAVEARSWDRPKRRREDAHELVERELWEAV